MRELSSVERLNNEGEHWHTEGGQLVDGTSGETLSSLPESNEAYSPTLRGHPPSLEREEEFRRKMPMDRVLGGISRPQFDNR